MLQKIVKYKIELLSSPHSALVAELDDLGAALSAARNLVQPMKQYIRTSKRSLLPTMYDELMTVHQFCDKHDLNIGADFGATCIKAVFDKKVTAESPSALSDALAVLRSNSFRWAGAAGSEGVIENRPATIAQQCIMLYLVDQLRRPLPDDVAEWAAMKAAMKADLELISNCLKEMADKFEEFENLRGTIASFTVVLSAAIGETHIAPHMVELAKQYLNGAAWAVQIR